MDLHLQLMIVLDKYMYKDKNKNMTITVKIKPVEFPVFGIATNLNITNVITNSGNSNVVLVYYTLTGPLPIEKIKPMEYDINQLYISKLEIPIEKYNLNKLDEFFILNYVASKLGVEITEDLPRVYDEVLPHVEIENSFDTYFDMVYLINLDSRADRLESTLALFDRLKITKYKRIVPVDASTLQPIELLTAENISCKLSHESCVEDAIANNYNRIMIFEDDICLNQLNPTIETNLGYHLNECFEYLKNNEWDIFYFDNILKTTKDSNKVLIKIERYDDTFGPFVRKILGKWYAHSYALNKTSFEKLLAKQKGNNYRNDNNLRNVKLNKYCYIKGIFDQKLGETSNN